MSILKTPFLSCIDVGVTGPYIIVKGGCHLSRREFFTKNKPSHTGQVFFKSSDRLY